MGGMSFQATIEQALALFVAVREDLAAHLTEEEVGMLRLDLAGQTWEAWLDWEENHINQVQELLREKFPEAALYSVHRVDQEREQRRLNFAALLLLDRAMAGLRIMRAIGVYCPEGNSFRRWLEQGCKMIAAAQKEAAELTAWPFDPPLPWSDR